MGSESASIDVGPLIRANAFVVADRKVSSGAIINCGAILDHDSKVGAFTHLNQGVIAGDAVNIGNIEPIGHESTLKKQSLADNDARISAMNLIATPHK
ncbi:hypothetical protein [Bdellovibrio bacteriovorus]|uniref:hypothetical protein n=1 Tax=Bdellovibrio bacteriovorus TaxID=959 RepID=UPI0035A736F4